MSGCGCRVAGVGLRVSGCGCRVAGVELPVSCCGLQIDLAIFLIVIKIQKISIKKKFPTILMILKNYIICIILYAI